MRQLRIAGMCRDMGAGNVVSPLLLALRERGHDTTLYVDTNGKAMGRVSHPEIPVGGDAHVMMILKPKPDVIVVGLSSPQRGLEEVFEAFARRNSIPVVHAEDYIKAFDRSAIHADLILSVDEAAAALADAACPSSRVVVAGFAGIMPMVPRQCSVDAFNEIRDKTGAKILYSNDADPRDAESTIGLLVESILLTQCPLRLIYKPHPKYAPMIVAGGRTQGEVMQDIIAPLRECGLLCDCPPGADGDEAAMLADATCSGYSTLLGRAAASGKIALTLRTPEAIKTFKEATTGQSHGLDETWMMSLRRGYPVIDSPQPLDDILSAPVPKFPIKPFDPRIAADAIEYLVVGR